MVVDICTICNDCTNAVIILKISFYVEVINQKT